MTDLIPEIIQLIEYKQEYDAAINNKLNKLNHLDL